MGDIVKDLAAARARAFEHGTICRGAGWSAPLTAAEIECLARGYSPLLVRPEHLLFFVPAIYAPPCGDRSL